MIRATLLLVLLVQVLPVVAKAQQALRLPAGTQLLFIVPEDSAVSSGIGGEGDVVIITGRPVGLVEPGDCATTPVSVQSATIVDPGHGRSARLTNELMVTLIALPSGEVVQPLAAGTRLTQLDTLGLCTGPGGRVFLRFRAVAE